MVQSIQSVYEAMTAGIGLQSGCLAGEATRRSNLNAKKLVTYSRVWTNQDSLTENLDRIQKCCLSGRALSFPALGLLDQQVEES